MRFVLHGLVYIGDAAANGERQHAIVAQFPAAYWRAAQMLRPPIQSLCASTAIERESDCRQFGPIRNELAYLPKARPSKQLAGATRVNFDFEWSNVAAF
jgi:hypothetical protein